MDTSDFAVAEGTHRGFDEVCAQLRAEPAAVLQAAADRQPTELHVEAGSFAELGSGMAVLHATWLDRAGRRWLETDVRVIAVNRGSQPLTELVMMGEGVITALGRAGVLAWARGVLGELAHTVR